MTRAPITVITGEVGAGKTTLLQKLLTESSTRPPWSG
jgi:G3E family GTPase